MGNDEKKEITKAQELPFKYVQILSWLSLLGMFIVDKLLNMPDPPLPEYWYGIAFGTASAGKINDLIKGFKGGK